VLLWKLGLGIVVFVLLGSGAAQAASYLDISGALHNPIQNTYGGNSAYSGSNLQPLAYLPGANLADADLPYANLWGANASYTNLADANLLGANLSYIDLSYANLPRANLYSTNLFFADLRYAELREVDLTLANLSFADLSFADLTLADLSNSYLVSANLSNVHYWNASSWIGAKYSLNAVDSSGNPIADTIFPIGMNQAWRDAAGMVAIPEPGTALLLGVGLVGLAVKRRRMRA
jgi:hypothetical protein